MATDFGGLVDAQNALISPETEQDFYVGARRDVLRRVSGVLRIARRNPTIDQNVLSAKNVSIFL